MDNERFADTLANMADLAGEQALGLDDRDPRGIYTTETEILAGTWSSSLLCKIRPHEPGTAPALNIATRDAVGTATYCTRCGTVLDFSLEEADA